VDELVGDAKRKIRSMMKGWSTSDGVPKDLLLWKDVSASSLDFFPVTSELTMIALLLLALFIERLGIHHAEIRHTKAGSNSPRRFQDQPSKSTDGTVGACFAMEEYSTTIYLLAAARDGALPQMAQYPPHVARLSAA